MGPVGVSRVGCASRSASCWVFKLFAVCDVFAGGGLSRCWSGLRLCDQARCLGVESGSGDVVVVVAGVESEESCGREDQQRRPTKLRPGTAAGRSLRSPPRDTHGAGGVRRGRVHVDQARWLGVESGSGDVVVVVAG